MFTVKSRSSTLACEPYLNTPHPFRRFFFYIFQYNFQGIWEENLSLLAIVGQVLHGVTSLVCLLRLTFQNKCLKLIYHFKNINCETFFLHI